MFPRTCVFSVDNYSLPSMIAENGEQKTVVDLTGPKLADRSIRSLQSLSPDERNLLTSFTKQNIPGAQTTKDDEIDLTLTHSEVAQHAAKYTSANLYLQIEQLRGDHHADKDSLLKTMAVRDARFVKSSFRADIGPN